jgi:hypothetical protein
MTPARMIADLASVAKKPIEKVASTNAGTRITSGLVCPNLSIAWPLNAAVKADKPE